MALSPETLQKLEESKQSLQRYLVMRIGEIEDLVSNLKAYGVPLDSLSARTTETAADEALVAIQDLLG